MHVAVAQLTEAQDGDIWPFTRFVIKVHKRHFFIVRRLHRNVTSGA